MAKPMTEPEMLNNLNAHYHKAFREVLNKHVFIDDTIYYVADVTVNTQSSYRPGFIILLERRYLCLTDLANRSGIKYFEEGSVLGRIFSGKPHIQRHWAFPNRDWKSIERSDILQIEQDYSTVKGIRDTTHTLKTKQQQSLVEISLQFHNRYGQWYKAFMAKDGIAIRDLLLQAMRNNGEIRQTPPPQSGDNEQTDTAKQMEMLIQLRNANLLTESEFEAKARQLLAKR